MPRSIKTFSRVAEPETTIAKDRNRVPGDQDYEDAQFALHHGISLDQAQAATGVRLPANT